MGTYVFIFWISLIPLIVWDGYYEAPKIFVFLLGAIPLALYWVVNIIKNFNFLKLEKEDFYYWIWLLILTISSLLGIHPESSIIGGSYRHQGVIFFIILWMIGKTVQIFRKDEKKILYKGVGFVVIVESLIVFYQIVFGKIYLGHPLGTIGEPNTLAGFLAVGLYFIFISYPKIVTIIPLLAILPTQSRSGILATIPNLTHMNQLIAKRFGTVTIFIMLFLAAFLLFYFSLFKENSFVENRLTIWPLAIEQIIKKPFTGYGAESGEVLFSNAFYVLGFPLSNLIIDRAHNLFLDVVMWSGLIGLIFFSLFLFERFKKKNENGQRFVFSAFLIYSMFQPLSIVHWLLFFLL